MEANETRTEMEAIVRRQLESYNARDLESLMATYADDAEQFEFPLNYWPKVRPRFGSDSDSVFGSQTSMRI